MISKSTFAIAGLMSLMSTALVSAQEPVPTPTINGCYWCVEEGRVWGLTSKSCLANDQTEDKTASLLMECFNSTYEPDPSSISSLDLTNNFLANGAQTFNVEFKADDQFREQHRIFYINNDRRVNFTFNCQGDNIKIFAIQSPNEFEPTDTVIEDEYCGSKLTMQPNTRIDVVVISVKGDNSVTIVTEAISDNDNGGGNVGFSTLSVVLISVGSVLGLGIIVGIVCYCKKKKEDDTGRLLQ